MATGLRSRHGCLGHGVRLVWVVHPEARAVDVYRPDDATVTISGEGALDGLDVLPRLLLPAGGGLRAGADHDRKCVKPALVRATHPAGRADPGWPGVGQRGPAAARNASGCASQDAARPCTLAMGERARPWRLYSRRRREQPLPSTRLQVGGGFLDGLDIRSPMRGGEKAPRRRLSHTT